MSSRDPIAILMADDDRADCRLVQKALEKSRLANRLILVHDGDALMDYLYRRGPYADRTQYPDPGVILLDLNMPKKSGHEALDEIREDPNLCHLPIVVLTTSEDEADVLKSYSLGASSYITKPVSFDDLVEVIRNLGNYWFEIVRLP